MSAVTHHSVRGRAVTAVTHLAVTRRPYCRAVAHQAVTAAAAASWEQAVHQGVLVQVGCWLLLLVLQAVLGAAAVAVLWLTCCWCLQRAGGRLQVQVLRLLQ